jgi:hypothetical protein
MTLIDPPSGWMYGFPLEAPEKPLYGTELEDWLISKGYPEKLARDLPYVRYIGDEEQNKERSEV